MNGQLEVVQFLKFLESLNSQQTDFEMMVKELKAILGTFLTLNLAKFTMKIKINSFVGVLMIFKVRKVSYKLTCRFVLATLLKNVIF